MTVDLENPESLFLSCAGVNAEKLIESFSFSEGCNSPLLQRYIGQNAPCPRVLIEFKVKEDKS